MSGGGGGGVVFGYLILLRSSYLISGRFMRAALVGAGCGVKIVAVKPHHGCKEEILKVPLPHSLTRARTRTVVYI